jgi:hypothetical protein
MHGTTPTGRDYADIAYYTHNREVFQGITRKIRLGYPQENYACNTLATVSARILCVPQHLLNPYALAWIPLLRHSCQEGLGPLRRFSRTSAGLPGVLNA